MHHADDRLTLGFLPLRADGGQGGGQRIGVGGIAGVNPRLCAQSGQPGQGFHRPFGGAAAPGDQRQMPHPKLGQLVRRLQADALHAAHHHHGAVAGQRRQGGAGRRALRRANDDFANMGGALQHPEAGFHIGMAEHGGRQRLQRAGGHAGADLGQQALGDIRARQRQLVHIDGEIGNVLPHRPQGGAAVFHIVALAEFDETAERAHQAEAAIHEGAGQRIEHHIDAIGPDLAQGVGEAEVAAV